MATNDKTGRIALGRRGEQLAADYLTERGFRLIDRNWRCRAGEIDLVLVDDRQDRGTVVFCEVKTRSGLGYGNPLEAITIEKAMRLRQLAGHWLADTGQYVDDVRIDAVGVILRRGEQPVITHIEGIDR